MLETTDSQLWAVHVLGPDDIHAAATHADALALCDELNALGLQNNAGKTPGDQRYVIHIAYPTPWPYSAEAHAESLALQRKDETEWAARKAAYKAKVNATGAPDARPVIPEGWRLVPVKITKGMEEAMRETTGALTLFFAGLAWDHLLQAAPTPPLHTEADVRADAQREALEKAEEIAVKQAQVAFDQPCESGQVDPSSGQFECGLKNCLCFERHETAQAIAAGISALKKETING